MRAGGPRCGPFTREPTSQGVVTAGGVRARPWASAALARDLAVALERPGEHERRLAHR